MRTDNPIISDEAKLNGQNIITEKYGLEYVQKNIKKSFKMKQSSSNKTTVNVKNKKHMKLFVQLI